MTEYNWNGYIVQADKEVTRDWYEKELDGWDCSCSGCRNFLASVKYLPQEFLDILKEMGIPPEKSVMVSYFESDKDRVRYNITYLVAGELIGRRIVSPETDADLPRDDIFCHRPLRPSYEECLNPCFELNYSGWLPWVLDEPIEDLL